MSGSEVKPHIQRNSSSEIHSMSSERDHFSLIEEDLDKVFAKNEQTIQSLEKDVNDPYIVDYEERDRIRASQKRLAARYEDRKLYDEIRQIPYFARMVTKETDLATGEVKECSCYIGKNAYSNFNNPKLPYEEGRIYDWFDAQSEFFYEQEGWDDDKPRVCYRGGKKIETSIIRKFNIEQKVLHEFYTTFENGKPKYKKGELDPYIRLILNKNRTRHGKLSDIVSSIQSEQNQIIRKNPSANFVVQGCAGSGKTQILIHRLAYLQGRKLLDGVERIFILTPNRQFNDYILSVQESLGINPNVIHTSSVEDYYVQLANACFDQSKLNLYMVYQPDSQPGNPLQNKEIDKSGNPVHISPAGKSSNTNSSPDESRLNESRLNRYEEESRFSSSILQKIYSPAFYQETEELVFNLWDSIMQTYPLPFAVFDAGFEPGYPALAKIEAQLEETMNSIRQTNPELLQKLEEAPKKIPILENRLKKAVPESTKASFVFQKRLEEIRQFLDPEKLSELIDSGSSSQRKETGKILNKLLDPEEKAIQKQIFATHSAIKKQLKKEVDQNTADASTAGRKSRTKAQAAAQAEVRSSFLAVIQELIDQSESVLENSRKSLTDLALYQLSMEKENYTSALNQLRKQITDAEQDSRTAEDKAEKSVQTGASKPAAIKLKSGSSGTSINLKELEKEETIFMPILEERWSLIDRMIQVRTARNNPAAFLDALLKPVFSETVLSSSTSKTDTESGDKNNLEAAPGNTQDSKKQKTLETISDQALDKSQPAKKNQEAESGQKPDKNQRVKPDQSIKSDQSTEMDQSADDNQNAEAGPVQLLKPEENASRPVKTLLATILEQLTFLEALFREDNPDRRFKSVIQSFQVLVPVHQYLELLDILDRTISIQSELEDLLTSSSQGMNDLSGVDFSPKEMRKQIDQIHKIWNWPNLFQMLILNRLPVAIQDTFDTKWLDHPDEPCLMHIHYRLQLYLTLMLAAQVLAKPDFGQSMLNIDEAQDLSLPEYMILQNIHSSDCIFNLYGDEKQNIYEYRGIDSWSCLDEVFSLEKISVENNYRNPVQVTSFCNKEFKTRIHEIGISDPAYEVRTIKTLDKALELFAGTLLNKPESSFAIICKDRQTKNQLNLLLNQENRNHEDSTPIITKSQPDPLKTLNGSGSLPLYTVKEAKGLEFQYVLALTDGMTRNEKYVSYTRALQQLFVCHVPNLIQKAQEIWAKSLPADHTLYTQNSSLPENLPTKQESPSSATWLTANASENRSAFDCDQILGFEVDELSNDPARSQWPEFTLPDLEAVSSFDQDRPQSDNLSEESEESESSLQDHRQLNDAKDVAALIHAIQDEELEKLEAEYALQKAEEERKEAERLALEQARKEARRLPRIQKEKEQLLKEAARKEATKKTASLKESSAQGNIKNVNQGSLNSAPDKDLLVDQGITSNQNNQNDQTVKSVRSGQSVSINQRIFTTEDQDRMIEAARQAGLAAAQAALAEFSKAQSAKTPEENSHQDLQEIHPEAQLNFEKDLVAGSIREPAAFPRSPQQIQQETNCSNSKSGPDYELLLNRIDDLQSRLDSALQKLEAIESSKNSFVKDDHHSTRSNSSLTIQESTDLLANKTSNLAPLPNPKQKDTLPGFVSKNLISDQILEKIDQSIEQAIPKAIDTALNSAVNPLTSSIAESVNEAITLSLDSKANYAIQNQLTKFVDQITMTIKDQITKTMADIQVELYHFIHQYDKRLSKALNKLDSQLARSVTSIVEKAPVVESVNQQASQKIVQNQRTDRQRVNTEPLAYGEEPSAIPASVNKITEDSGSFGTSNPSNLTSDNVPSSNQTSLKTKIPVKKLLKMTRIDKNTKVSAGDPVHHDLYGNGIVVRTKLTKYQVRFIVNNSEQIIDLPKYGSNLYLLEQ